MNSTNTASIPSTLRAHSGLLPLKPLLRSKLRWKPFALLGFLIHPVSAAEFGDFYYTDNGTTITIDNYIGLGGAVSLPASILGKPVTAIADGAFQTRPEITSVTIPDAVTSIGIRAFQECPNLASVISVSLVGMHAKDFVLTKPVKTSLPPATATAPATTFKVTFKPKAKGTRIAAIRIKSNDTNENPFDIPLSGAGAK